MAAGKVKTTGEIYKHKMQVNNESTLEQVPSTLTPVKEGEGVGDVSSTAVPPLPSLDQTQEVLLQKEEEQVVVPGAEGGEGDTREVEGGEKTAEEDGLREGGGEEEMTLTQEQS